MKTAEEILEKHCPSMNNLYLDEHGRNFRDRVVAAMKEYASLTPNKGLTAEEEQPQDNSHGDLVPLVWMIEELRRMEGGCTMNELIAKAKYNFTGLEFIKKAAPQEQKGTSHE